jgi:hypothetical protein
LIDHGHFIIEDNLARQGMHHIILFCYNQCQSCFFLSFARTICKKAGGTFLDLFLQISKINKIGMHLGSGLQAKHGLGIYFAMDDENLGQY